jgi:hypothetical protein
VEPFERVADITDGSKRLSAQDERMAKEGAMKKLLAGFACTVIFVQLVAGAANTNFSGTWVLDKAKSKGLPPQLEAVESYTLVVTQDDQQLTVETKIAGGASRNQGPGGEGRRGFAMGIPKATYQLDGRETTMEMSAGMPGKITFKAKWKNNGQALELVTTRNMSFQGNEVTMTTTDRWELAEDGKVLKVKRTAETRRGSQEYELVFNKQ